MRWSRKARSEPFIASRRATFCRSICSIDTVGAGLPRKRGSTYAMGCPLSAGDRIAGETLARAPPRIKPDRPLALRIGGRVAIVGRRGRGRCPGQLGLVEVVGLGCFELVLQHVDREARLTFGSGDLEVSDADGDISPAHSEGSADIEDHHGDAP